MRERPTGHGTLDQEIEGLLTVLHEQVGSDGEASGADARGRDVDSGTRRPTGSLGGFLSARTLDSLADLADEASIGLRRAAGAVRARADERGGKDEA